MPVLSNNYVDYTSLTWNEVSYFVVCDIIFSWIRPGVYAKAIVDGVVDKLVEKEVLYNSFGFSF